MGRKHRILVASVIASVLGGFTCELIRPHEPEYHGRRLTSWLAYDAAHLPSLDAMATQAEQDRVEDAVRHIGPDAIPVLMKLLRARDGVFNQQLVSLSLRYPFIPLHPRSAAECNAMAILGFKILGSIAKPAVPALTKLLDDSEGDGAVLASMALARIGPCAQASVPALVRNLRDRNALVRCTATNALRQISREAALNAGVGRV
ncbi:MAG: domain containing protein [Pedosphaera sp.]|nr:domain containing protein [Pedosphaera sp.]